MAYEGWLSLGDVEIINSSKTWHAARAAGVPLHCDDDCPDLGYALGDEPYQSVQTFPWSDDATVPPGFLGFMGNKISGLDTGVAVRRVADLALGGAAVGPVRRRRREMTVSVLAFATSEASLNFGIAWLNSILRESSCPGSGGTTMCVYSECPDSLGQTIPADDLHESHLRNLFNVGVLEPPSVVSRTRLGAACTDAGVGEAWMAEIEFMLVAGNSSIYTHPILVVSLDEDDFVDFEGDPNPACIEVPDCRFDDDRCTPPPIPPAVPIPDDLCAEPGPGPYQLATDSISGSTLSDWFEKVPVIRVLTEFESVYSTTISFIQNARGLNCGDVGVDERATCDACDSIYIPYLPASSTLEIDGRKRETTLECRVFGPTAPAPPRIYGRNGSLFVWPTLECGTDYCLRILREISEFNINDTTIEVSIAERRDAI